MRPANRLQSNSHPVPLGKIQDQYSLRNYAQGRERKNQRCLQHFLLVENIKTQPKFVSKPSNKSSLLVYKFRSYFNIYHSQFTLVILLKKQRLPQKFDLQHDVRLFLLLDILKWITPCGVISLSELDSIRVIIKPRYV